jgi:cytochrome c oxidase subunit IV
MADTHHGGEHHGPSFQQYMIIAGILAVCTGASFLVNQVVSAKFLAFVLILSVAILKASLVGAYFMHLKWDWKLLYFLIIPAFILGTMMMIVLMPDALLGPSRDMADGYEIAAKEQP